MEDNTKGVRKGAWRKNEDDLLRECIEKHGEGKWHLVPIRAGLNRCRKSCRLRWLNYLRPDIKRGIFSEDEVDLLLRLHKLLGNRWALIAGRLPGRTANDVKNYFNSHHKKKIPDSSVKISGGETPIAGVKVDIIKPKPFYFSRMQEPQTDLSPVKETAVAKAPVEELGNDPPLSSQEVAGGCVRWWRDILDITENESGSLLAFSDGSRGILDSTPMVLSNDEDLGFFPLSPDDF